MSPLSQAERAVVEAAMRHYLYGGGYEKPNDFFVQACQRLHAFRAAASGATYDRTFGDDKQCSACGHAYYRHFDTYEEMAPVGCKYCSCSAFIGGCSPSGPPR